MLALFRQPTLYASIGFVGDACMTRPQDKEVTGRAKGGVARAKALGSNRRSEIAKKAALARWGSKATHKGSFKRDFGIDIDCFVLDDPQKTAVISQRGMAEALGYSKIASGSRILEALRGPRIAPYTGPELIKKIENPLIFQWVGPGAGYISHGYDVTILIDVCKAIINAEADGKLAANQKHIARQAHIILSASAKAGIKGLVYALAGYNPSAKEVIEAFKLYIQEEARKYEPEFPNELYVEWHRLYDIPVPARGKPWHFKYLTVRHIYHPLAQSRGKIYALLKALKSNDGDRRKKMFQFLNEVGARALRMHLGRVLEMAEASPNKEMYEKRITQRFGDQQELDLVVPSDPIALPPPS
jgi:hypothetical protein